jgi:hypothetical protein
MKAQGRPIAEAGRAKGLRISHEGVAGVLRARGSLTDMIRFGAKPRLRRFAGSMAGEEGKERQPWFAVWFF